MKVSDFKEFIAIANLAEMDIGEPRLTFIPGDKLSVYYQGLHCFARTIAKEGVLIDGLDSPRSSNVRVLRGGLGLLGDEAELTVTYQYPSFVLRAAGKRLSLRTGESSPFPAFSKSKSTPPTVAVKRQELLDSLRLLVEITTRKVTSPVLTGVHVTTSDAKLRLEATDGMRAAVVELDAQVKNGPLDNVIPAYDLQLAAGVVEGDSLMFADRGSTVEIATTHTRIRLSTLAGKFPDLSPLGKKEPKHQVTVGAPLIDAVKRASALLDDSRLVTLQTKDGRVMFRVHGEEQGVFEVAVGRDEVEDFSLTFDAEYLGVADRVGSQIAVQVVDNFTPVVFQGESGWKYWLSPVIIQ